MPTYATDRRFSVDFGRLSTAQQAAFMVAVAKFVADLKRGPLRKGLRVKGVQGWPGVWELTWAGDGRATFEYGDSLRPGDPHILWRRVGSHDILANP